MKHYQFGLQAIIIVLRIAVARLGTSVARAKVEPASGRCSASRLRHEEGGESDRVAAAADDDQSVASGCSASGSSASSSTSESRTSYTHKLPCNSRWEQLTKN